MMLTQQTLYLHIFLVEARPALSVESSEHQGGRGPLPDGPMAFISCLILPMGSSERTLPPGHSMGIVGTCYKQSCTGS